MAYPILFIQGGGNNGYEADKALVSSLQKHLGAAYKIDYPKFPSDESLPDFGWMQYIDQLLLQSPDELILVGHSLGASMLLKFLSEKGVVKTIKGLFLIATPFWHGKEEWKAGLKLQENFAGQLPPTLPVFFYHCQDDDVAPVSDLDYYMQKLTHASFRKIKTGGHQLNNDLTLVANDIKSIS